MTLVPRSLGRAALLASLVAPLSAALAAVEREPGIGLPRDVSHDGHLIDDLMHVGHYFDITLFAIMCVWMFYACFAHSGKRHQAVYTHGDSKRSVMMVLGVCSAVLLVVDGNLFVNTVIGLDKVFWNYTEPKNNPDTVRIEINAHQWAWDGRYAGPDKKFATPGGASDDDIVVWNDFKVPVDTPIWMQLTSTDVIHSFYLPNFRVKMDAVPGQVNQMWFKAKQVGEFEVGCTQHCGTHHYKMKAKLTVLSKEDYARWQQEASLLAKRAYDKDDAAAHWGWEWKEF